MRSNVLLDYEFAVTSRQFVVRALLKLEGQIPDAADRIPLNLSLVLDRSGSMSGEKLAAARDAASLLARRLHPEDVLSLVTYDDTVQTVAPPATGVEQEELSRAIRSIQSGGMTNLSGGWLRGRELVAGGRRPEGVNRVILLTDGLANVGITDPAALTGLCREAREHGVTTTTIGFGADYNEHLLRAMADAGGGHTYYIERPDQAPGIFEEEMEGLLSLCAQNVTVDLAPAAAVQLTTVHHSFPRAPVPGGVRLEVGDLYAREPKKVLLEFLVPALATAVETEIAEVVVTAIVLTAGGGVQRQEIRLPIRASLDQAGCRDPEVQREALLVEAARAREEALAAQARGDYEAGGLLLREVAARIRSKADGADAELQEEVRDLGAMSELYGDRTVSAMDLKYMHQRSYNTARGRGGSTARISRSSRGGPGPAGPDGIRYLEGDVTRPHGQGRMLIVHAADDAGGWGQGVARAISRRWPEPEARYRDWAGGGAGEPQPFRPGAVQITPVEAGLWVATLVTNESADGSGHSRIRYEALDRALGQLAGEALRLDASVHMPRLSGGDWRRIEPILRDRLCREGVPVTVYELP
jgi:Ca-activated chloride channel homolog